MKNFITEIKYMAGSESKTQDKTTQKKVVFKAETPRTSDILKAYITFTYRKLHPGVTPRLVLYGILVTLPGIFFFKDLYWRLFFTVIGIALILLAFFRQYISLSITKKNDPDYINGSNFTYDFYDNKAVFSKNGEAYSGIPRYKDVTAFYYDDKFYYLAMARELTVLPKAAFTIGTPEDFEEFIYKKSKVVCRWLPYKLSDRIKQRRARRAAESERR